MYKEKLTEIVNQLMTDEISAATMYLEAAGYLDEITLVNEITQHADEEYGHFKKLMDFATNHGLKISYDFSRPVIKKVPKSTPQLLRIIQDLEKKAIADYKGAALLARENQDIEAEELFSDIMKDEISHFDDIAIQTKEVRALGESSSFKMFMKGNK